jgi:hypothetical protein
MKLPPREIRTYLAEKDQSLLDYIKTVQHETGYPPSIPQIIEYKKCAGEIPVKRSLNKLRTKGFIDWAEKIAYVNEEHVRIPVVGEFTSQGRVAFGNPNAKKCIDISMLWVGRYFALELRSEKLENRNLSQFTIFERCSSQAEKISGTHLYQIDGRPQLTRGSKTAHPIAKIIGFWEGVNG